MSIENTNRLQLLRAKEIFESKDALSKYILKYYEDNALTAEPFVMFYKNGDETRMVLLIGDENAKSNHNCHMIDISATDEAIENLKGNVDGYSEAIEAIKEGLEELKESLEQEILDRENVDSNIAEKCGLIYDVDAKKYKYNPDNHDEVLRDAKSLAEAIDLLSKFTQASLVVYKFEDTDTVEFTSEVVDNVETIKANVKVSKENNDTGTHDDNIIVKRPDGIAAYIDLSYNEAENALEFTKSFHEDGRPENHTTKKITLGSHTTVEVDHTSNLVYEIIVNGKVEGTINIPEYQFFKDAKYDRRVHELTLTLLVDGETKDVVINMDELVDVYKAGNGLELATDGTFNVIVNPASEGFLTIDNNGIAVNGINDAIKTAKEEAINDSSILANKEIENTKKELNQSILDEANRAKQAEKDLAHNIEDAKTEEENRAKTEEADLLKKIDAEVARAEGAEKVLTDAIVAEKERAEKDVINKVKEEEHRANLAEADLLNKIDAEVTRAKGEEKVLTDAVVAEKERAEKVEKSLRVKQSETKSIIVTPTINEEGTQIISNVKISGEQKNATIIKTDGLYVPEVKVSYDAITNTITFECGNEPKKDFQLAGVTAINDVRYDSESQTMVFTIVKEDGAESEVPVELSGLIPSILGTDGNETPIKIIVTKDEKKGDLVNVISAEVNNVWAKDIKGLYHIDELNADNTVIKTETLNTVDEAIQHLINNLRNAFTTLAEHSEKLKEVNSETIDDLKEAIETEKQERIKEDFNLTNTIAEVKKEVAEIKEYDTDFNALVEKEKARAMEAESTLSDTIIKNNIDVNKKIDDLTQADTDLGNRIDALDNKIGKQKDGGDVTESTGLYLDVENLEKRVEANEDNIDTLDKKIGVKKTDDGTVTESTGLYLEIEDAIAEIDDKIASVAVLKKAQVGDENDTLDTSGNIVPSVAPSGKEVIHLVFYSETEKKYNKIDVDVEQMILESEAGNGLKIDNHIVSVKLDDNNEGDYLTVGDGGLKLTGIKALSDKIGKQKDGDTVTESTGLYKEIENAVAEIDDKIASVAVLKKAQVGDENDTLDTSGNIVPSGAPSGKEVIHLVFYSDADKAYNKIDVDVEQMILESEAGDGLKIDNHIVSVKLDADNESEYLTVGEGGLKLTGIKEIEKVTSAALNNLNDRIINLDSKYEDAVGDEENRAKQVEGALQSAIDEIKNTGGGSVASETSRAQQAEAALGRRIDDLNDKIGEKKDVGGATESKGLYLDVEELQGRVSTNETAIAEIKNTGGGSVETNAGNGLQIVNNTVSVKLDATNENRYLSVSENGLKLTGIKALSDKIGEKKTDDGTVPKSTGLYEEIEKAIAGVAVLKKAQVGDENDTLDTSGNIVSSKSPSGKEVIHLVFYADNKYTKIDVDVEQMILESEAGDGLKIDNHIVSVKLDADNENEYLTVGEGGLKLTGIKDLAKKVNANENNITILNNKIVDSDTIDSKIDDKIGKKKTDDGTVPKSTGLYEEIEKAIAGVAVLKKAQVGDEKDTLDAAGNIVPSGAPSGKEVIHLVFYADNKYTKIDVDVEQMILESEAGNGLKIDNHIVSVKLDDNNEGDYLTVGEGGLKLTGIKDLAKKVADLENKPAITGTGNQIKVDGDNKISFADDAIFDCGEY